MVATTDLSKRAERDLIALEADIADLPLWAAEWNAMTDGERAATVLERDHVSIDYLSELVAWQQQAMLDREQHARHNALLRRLAEVGPLLAQLGLHDPLAIRRHQA